MYSKTERLAGAEYLKDLSHRPTIGGTCQAPWEPRLLRAKTPASCSNRLSRMPTRPELYGDCTCAENRTCRRGCAASGGVQPGAVVPHDDRSGNAANPPGRRSRLVFCSSPADLGPERPESTATPTSGCHLAPNVASPPVHSTGTRSRKKQVLDTGC
jgi:hypothetical protein